MRPDIPIPWIGRGNTCSSTDASDDVVDITERHWTASPAGKEIIIVGLLIVGTKSLYRGVRKIDDPLFSSLATPHHDATTREVYISSAKAPEFGTSDCSIHEQLNDEAVPEAASIVDQALQICRTQMELRVTKLMPHRLLLSLSSRALCLQETKGPRSSASLLVVATLPRCISGPSSNARQEPAAPRFIRYVSTSKILVRGGISEAQLVESLFPNV